MQPIQQNGNAKVLAQWVKSAEEMLNRYSTYPAAVGPKFANIILCEQSLWGWYWVYIDKEKCISYPCSNLYNFNVDSSFLNPIRDDILYKRLGPPTFGAYPDESIQTGCQCSSRDIFNFGCPSAKGQKCRSI